MSLKPANQYQMDVQLQTKFTVVVSTFLCKCISETERVWRQHAKKKVAQNVDFRNI